MRRVVPILFVLLFVMLRLDAQTDSLTPRRDTGARRQQSTAPRPTPRVQATDSLTAASGPDSLQTDTLPPVVESTAVSRRPAQRLTPWNIIPGIPLKWQALKHHTLLAFDKPVLVKRSDLHKHIDRDLLFYGIAGLVLFFAILRLSFAKYQNDLFRVFFRTTMKQRQIREQLMQTPLPSLLFNLFFVMSAGMYLNFLFHHLGFTPVRHFWLLYGYCCAGLAVLYLGKYLILKFAGWVFGISDAADSYIFIVFIINKMIGIFLLPVVVILAFGKDPVHTVALVLSWCVLGGLFAYRFILGFSAVRNQVRFNLFHFLLYLAAFEVAPLVLIYRVLLGLD